MRGDAGRCEGGDAGRLRTSATISEYKPGAVVGGSSRALFSFWEARSSRFCSTISCTIRNHTRESG